MECVEDDDDETQAPVFVVHDTHRSKWMNEEAVVDSGVIEYVTCR